MKPEQVDNNALRKASRLAVLRIIRTKGRVSRKGISDLTGLSFATVCRAVDDLVEESLVYEVESIRIGGARRKTTLLDVNPDGGWVVAIDLGGSRINAAAMDLSGTIRESLEVTLENAKGEESVIPALASALDAINFKSRRLGVPPLAIGISSSGIVDPQSGTVKLSFNLQLRDFPIARIVHDRCSSPTVVCHDTAASALAEAKLGKGRERGDFAYITVGTGVGAGIVMGGKLRDLPQDAEFGLMVVAPEGDPERFGGRGYLESVASGRGIAAAALRELGDGRQSLLNELPSASVTAQTVAEAARQGDELAKGVLARAAYHLGIGIVNLAHTLGLSLFVIGGGVSMSGEPFWAPLRQTIERYEYWPGRIQLVPSLLGKNAALLGAGMIAIDQALDTKSAHGIQTCCESLQLPTRRHDE